MPYSVPEMSDTDPMSGMIRVGNSWLSTAVEYLCTKHLLYMD